MRLSSVVLVLVLALGVFGAGFVASRQTTTTADASRAVVDLGRPARVDLPIAKLKRAPAVPDLAPPRQAKGNPSKGAAGSGAATTSGTGTTGTAQGPGVSSGTPGTRQPQTTTTRTTQGAGDIVG